jgi:hypothetical protein
MMGSKASSRARAHHTHHANSRTQHVALHASSQQISVQLVQGVCDILEARAFWHSEGQNPALLMLYISPAILLLYIWQNVTHPYTHAASCSCTLYTQTMSLLELVCCRFVVCHVGTEPWLMFLCSPCVHLSPALLSTLTLAYLPYSHVLSTLQAMPEMLFCPQQHSSKQCTLCNKLTGIRSAR